MQVTNLRGLLIISQCIRREKKKQFTYTQKEVRKRKRQRNQSRPLTLSQSNSLKNNSPKVRYTFLMMLVSRIRY